MRVHEKTFQINQYVYVYSILFHINSLQYLFFKQIYPCIGDNDLAFIDDPSQGGRTGYTFTFQQGNSGLVPCKSTHPNVTITLKTDDSGVIKNLMKKKQTVYFVIKWYHWINWQNLLSESTSNWQMEPKRGITLKRAMISDTNSYYCIGSMNNLTNTVQYFSIIVESNLLFIFSSYSVYPD